MSAPPAVAVGLRRVFEWTAGAQSGRFEFSLICLIGTDVGALLVAMGRDEAVVERLRAHFEEYVLLESHWMLGEPDSSHTKGTIQIGDWFPAPKKYVLVRPLGPHGRRGVDFGRWVEYETGDNIFGDTQEMRDTLENVLRNGICGDRAPTAEDEREIQKRLMEGLAYFARESNALERVDPPNRRRGSLLNSLSNEGFLHRTMDSVNDTSRHRNRGANETVSLVSVAAQAYARPRPTAARRVLFAVAASHEVVSYGGAIADWSYTRKLLSVHAFLGGDAEPVCALAYSFPFCPGPGEWGGGMFGNGCGEAVDDDGWTRRDGLRVATEAEARSLAEALGVDEADVGALLRAVICIANVRDNCVGQWNALECFHATGRLGALKNGHWADGREDDRAPFARSDDPRADPKVRHLCGAGAVAAFPRIADARGDPSAESCRTSPTGLLDAVKVAVARRLRDPASTATFTALARALHGVEAEATGNVPDYYNNTPKTLADANAINEDALRFYGIPEGRFPYFG